MSNDIVPGITVGKFGAPDEIRLLLHGQVAVLKLGGHQVHRAEFEPGWTWKGDVQPKVGTSSCQVQHCLAVLEGSMEITMDDGTVVVINPGDVASIAPGHDAKILGAATFRGLDFLVS